MNISKKKFIRDFIINIIAVALPIGALQLFVLPYVSRDLADAEKYGLIITLIGIFTISSAPFGGALNNIRLMYNYKYKEDGLTGDFNILLILSSVTSSIVVSILFCIYNKDPTILEIFYIVVIAILNLLNTYQVVAFKINLDYKNVLVNNLFMIIGYIVGVFIYSVCGIWQLIYIMGYLASSIFMFLNSSLLKEPITITPLFSQTAKNVSVLTIASFMGVISTYFDRLFLYPFFGGEMVAIYYAGTVINKMLAMFITPLNSVILSYLSRIKKILYSDFWLLFFCSCGISVITFVLCLLISPFILGFLYPEYAEQAQKIIPITSGIASINIISSIIKPTVLKFRKIYLQIILSLITLLLHFISAILGISFGLTGFCLGELAVSIFQVTMITLFFCLTKPIEV